MSEPTNLSLLMRLGDFAPKILEERRKLELPREGDTVYYAGGLRAPGIRVTKITSDPAKQRLGDSGVPFYRRTSTMPVPEDAQSSPHVAERNVRVGQLWGGGTRLGWWRGEGQNWARGRAEREVDTNELYDRAIAEQLDFISKRETRGNDIEGGGAVGGVDPERSRYHPLFDPEDRPEDPYTEPEPKRTLPIPAAMKHFDPPPTDEQIRDFMADLGSGRVWVTSPTNLSASYNRYEGEDDDDL